MGPSVDRVSLDAGCSVLSCQALAPDWIMIWMLPLMEHYHFKLDRDRICQMIPELILSPMTLMFWRRFIFAWLILLEKKIWKQSFHVKFAVPRLAGLHAMPRWSIFWILSQKVMLNRCFWALRMLQLVSKISCSRLNGPSWSGARNQSHWQKFVWKIGKSGLQNMRWIRSQLGRILEQSQGYLASRRLYSMHMQAVAAVVTSNGTCLKLPNFTLIISSWLHPRISSSTLFMATFHVLKHVIIGSFTFPMAMLWDLLRALHATRGVRRATFRLLATLDRELYALLRNPGGWHLSELANCDRSWLARCSLGLPSNVWWPWLPVRDLACWSIRKTQKIRSSSAYGDFRSCEWFWHCPIWEWYLFRKVFSAPRRQNPRLSLCLGCQRWRGICTAVCWPHICHRAHRSVEIPLASTEQLLLRSIRRHYAVQLQQAFVQISPAWSAVKLSHQLTSHTNAWKCAMISWMAS